MLITIITGIYVYITIIYTNKNNIHSVLSGVGVRQRNTDCKRDAYGSNIRSDNESYLLSALF